MIDALQMATLCALSYQENADGFTQVDDLAFGVFEQEDKFIIVFRGSDNLKNWLRDFEVIPTEWDGEHSVHTGFARATRRLIPYILPFLKTSKHIVFTGHSLGGAIAVLMGHRFDQQIVSFGCPRIWLELQPTPKLRHWRIRDDDDPVTMIPFGLCHDASAIVKTLCDSDHSLIDVEDHTIDVYLGRLQNETGITMA